MSAFSIEAARSERATAVHRHTGARILQVYVQTSESDGVASEFPVSGDMLALIRRAGHAAIHRRRRHAARVCAEHEGVA